MHFLIYPTERCNLHCSYCDTEEERKKLVMDRTYNIDTLKKFLKQDKNVSITFYGGEPTLDVDFIKELMDSIDFKYVSIVTNGFQLDKVPIEYLQKMNMISLSIDGTKETTDACRGKGAYDTVMSKALWLKNINYKGLKTARMTITLGTDIEKEVMHLIQTGLFELVHWQLDVFHEYSFLKPDEFKKWFDDKYNPGIKRLIKYWVDYMIKHKKVLKIVPFIGIMYSLVTNQKQGNVRCGAGHAFWIISTTGNIYPCPVLRDDNNYLVSDITKPINDIKPQFLLKSPCTECDYFPICGGRCIYGNIHARDRPIFKVVCGSIRYLISALEQVKPTVVSLIASGEIRIEDFTEFYEHEVIP